MEEILGLCGYRCDLCQFYAGNIKSQEDKERGSREFKEVYGFDIQPEDVECVGCKNKGKHVDKDCPVRPCALKKGVGNCGHCSECNCDRLKEKTHYTEEFLKENKKPISEENFEKYIKPYQCKEARLETRSKTVRCAGGILRKGNKFLLGKRSESREFYPGVWDIIGGHCEEGETLEKALVREIQEEIGVNATEFQHIAQLSEEDAALHGNHDYHVYLVTQWDGVPQCPLDGEHSEISWFGYDEAGELDLAHSKYPQLFKSLAIGKSSIVQ